MCLISFMKISVQFKLLSITAKNVLAIWSLVSFVMVSLVSDLASMMTSLDATSVWSRWNVSSRSLMTLSTLSLPRRRLRARMSSSWTWNQASNAGRGLRYINARCLLCEDSVFAERVILLFLQSTEFWATLCSRTCSNFSVACLNESLATVWMLM